MKKVLRRSWRVIPLLAISTSLVSTGLVANASTLLVTPTTVTTSTTTSPVSGVPSNTASMAMWQSWAASQQAQMQSITPSQVAATSGCSISSVTASPVVSSGFEYPAGITTDALTIVGQCSPSTGGSLSASPAISSYCPGMDDCNFASATNGQVAIGTTTVAGNANFMEAAFTNTSTSSISVHSQLGTVGVSPCSSTASVVANSSQTTLSPGMFVAVTWGPRTTSTTWKATGWKLVSGAFQDLGSVCGQY